MWKKYKDFPIEANEKGEIRNFNTKKIRKPTVSKRGYLVFTSHSNGKQHLLYLHRVVAELFIKNPNNHNCVNHIDGNKQNPRKDNLEWCTHKENTYKAYHTQNLIKKYTCKCCKKEFFISGRKKVDNICATCYNKIKQEENKLLVLNDKINKRKLIIQNIKSLSNNTRNSLYRYYIAHKDIFELWSLGNTKIEIAKEIGCTRQNIDKIINNLTFLYNTSFNFS